MKFDRQAYFDMISGKRTDALAGICRAGLSLLEWPYAMLMRLRNFMFDKGLRKIHKLDVPVVSVGNLTVGGTGKTPFVAWLAQKYLDAGKLPAIVSRGYHADETGWNDEAKELKLLLPDVPQAFSKNRFKAAQQLLAEHDGTGDKRKIDVVILDDGFQHQKLSRDHNILLIDATNPFGYDRITPRGLLREPISAIKRADIVVLSRADAADDAKKDRLRGIVKHYSPNAVWLEMTHSPRFLLFASGEKKEIATVAGQAVFAFCGLGNPDAFYKTVENCGCRIADKLTYSDHCIYDNNDAVRLAGLCRSAGAKYAVCSLKDFVKIRHWAPINPGFCAIVIESDLSDFAALTSILK